MRQRKNRTRMMRRIEGAIKPPFMATVVKAKPIGDQFVVTVEGMGEGHRDEVILLAGAPIVEWIATGTEVLVIPHLFRSAELLIVGREHHSAVIAQLQAMGDFAIERGEDCYMVFKTAEMVHVAPTITMTATTAINLTAPDIMLGADATKNVALDTDYTDLQTVGDHGTHKHQIVSSATIVKAK